MADVYTDSTISPVGVNCAGVYGLHLRLPVSLTGAFAGARLKELGLSVADKS